MPTTLTATALPDQAAIRLQLESAGSATLTNLVPNPAPDSTSLYSVSRMSAAMTGDGWLRVTQTMTGQGYVYPMAAASPANSQRYPAVAGDKIAVRVQVRNPSATTAIRVRVVWNGYSWNGTAWVDALNEPAIPSTVLLAPGATTTLEHTVVWAGDGTHFLPLLYPYTEALASLPVGESVDCQEWAVFIGPSAPDALPVPYFSGATPDTFDADHSWTGTANASPSTRAATGVRTLKSLTRSDSNGTRAVRLFEDQELTGGSLITSDYEAALVGLVTYTAEVQVGDVTEDASASVTTLGATLPVLAPATTPQYRREVELITGYDDTRTALTTVHDVVGRPDPLVVFGPLGMRRGQLRIVIRTYTQAREIEAVYERGEVVLLRQSVVAGLDLYHVALRTSLSPDATRWLLSVDYVEVAAPIGPLLGALGWTFDAASDAFDTFAAARAAYPTFNAYTIGPE